MLCIDSSQSQEQEFILGTTNILLRMENAGSLWTTNTRRLIIEEVDRTPSAKINAISLSASKSFLARHLLDDCNDGIVEPLNGE